MASSSADFVLMPLLASSVCAVELRLQIVDLAAAIALLRDRLAVGGAQLLDAEPRGGERRVGLRQRDAVGLGIDPEQHVALP